MISARRETARSLKTTVTEPVHRREVVKKPWPGLREAATVACWPHYYK
jgi:hypothetical protein